MKKRTAIVIFPTGPLVEDILEYRYSHGERLRHNKWPEACVKLLYPWVDEPKEKDLEKVRQIVESFEAFRVNLSKLKYAAKVGKEWRATGYLDPVSDRPNALIDLQSALASAFPDCNELISKTGGKYAPQMRITNVSIHNGRLPAEREVFNILWRVGEVCVMQLDNTRTFKRIQRYYMRRQSTFYNFDSGEIIEKRDKSARRFVNYVRRDNLFKINNPYNPYSDLYAIQVPTKPNFYTEIGPIMKGRTRKKRRQEYVSAYSLPKMPEVPFPPSLPPEAFKPSVRAMCLFSTLLIFLSIWALEHYDYLDLALTPLLDAVAKNSLSIHGLFSYISVISWGYGFFKLLINPNTSPTNKTQRTFRATVMTLLTVFCLNTLF